MVCYMIIGEASRSIKFFDRLIREAEKFLWVLQDNQSACPILMTGLVSKLYRFIFALDWERE